MSFSGIVTSPEVDRYHHSENAPARRGLPGFPGTHYRPKALGLQRVPGSAAKRMAPREATGRDLSPAVTEVAERTEALITIRPRSTGPFALLQTPAPRECFVDSCQRNRAHPSKPTLLISMAHCRLRTRRILELGMLPVPAFPMLEWSFPPVRRAMS